MLLKTYKQYSWSKKAPWKTCLRYINTSSSDDFVLHAFGIAHLKSDFDKQYAKMEKRLCDKYCPQLSRMIFDGIKNERF